MRTFFKWLAIVVGVLLAIFVIGGIFLPRTWKVEESITIVAPKEKIYEQIANLRNWQNWSPWTQEMDETQIYSYEGPESGTGAKWLWTSEKMGTGYLEIKDADVNSGIDYVLFIDMKSSQSTINGAIKYSGGDAQTVVWSDSGDSGNNLMKRWFSLPLKSMLSKEMRSGLEKLKSIVETK